MSDFDTSFLLEPLANVVTEQAVQQAARLQASGGLGPNQPPGVSGTTAAVDGGGNDINQWFFTVGLDAVDTPGPVIR